LSFWPDRPRDRDKVRHGDKPFAFQARLTLDNQEAAANAAGLSLRDAVRVGVFLKNRPTPRSSTPFTKSMSEIPFPPAP
jgi:enamine deaminase RidA (YjgF/YER057c/UK114 family)